MEVVRVWRLGPLLDVDARLDATCSSVEDAGGGRALGAEERGFAEGGAGAVEGRSRLSAERAPSWSSSVSSESSEPESREAGSLADFVGGRGRELAGGGGDGDGEGELRESRDKADAGMVEDKVNLGRAIPSVHFWTQFII
jgi:transcription elongation factor